MDFVEEQKIIKEFLNGSDIAFKQIVDKYSSKIYWHARGMLNNHFDADEVTQEVIIILYKKLHTFNFNSSLYTWIYQVTHRKTLNFIRKNNVKSFFSLSDGSYNGIESTVDIYNDFEKRDEVEQIEKVLQRIPTRQREVFIMKNFEEINL